MKLIPFSRQALEWKYASNMLLFSGFGAVVTDARHRRTHRDEDPPAAQHCWPNPESSQSSPDIIHITLFSLFGQTNHETLICCALCSTASPDKCAHMPQKTHIHISACLSSSHTYTDVLTYIFRYTEYKTNKKLCWYFDRLPWKYTQMNLWKFSSPKKTRLTKSLTDNYFLC